MAAATGYYFPQISGDPTSFSFLRTEAWRQFNPIELDLRAQLTIITGSNGTGKTTLLSLVGVHFNWNMELIGTPVLGEDGHITFKLGTDVPIELATLGAAGATPPGYTPPPTSKIGSLEYENGVITQLLVPEFQTPQISMQYDQQQNVEGVFLSSHRSISAYQPAAWIPARFSPARELLESFLSEIRSRHFGLASEKSSMLVMKESLLAAAIHGEGNSSVAADDGAWSVWNGFQDTLRELLPVELGFQRLKASPPEVILVTKTGDFTIDALSGGLRAIFELAWQIFLRSRNSEVFTVCIDEPENHLHPALQRSLMPSLMKAFPRVKFLVATHSPFVVRSVNDANVYALTYDESNHVSATLLDLKGTGLSAEDTLRDVLGVDSTLPMWAEATFNEILARFSAASPNSDTISDLRDALVAAGLSSEMPIAVETLVNSQDKHL